MNETLHYYVNGVAQNSPQSLNMDTLYTYDTGGEGKVLSVNYPETWAWSNSGNDLVSTAGPAYTYSFDAMYRPTGLKDQNNNTVVNNVSYNAANQLLTFNTETHTYNNLNQMTQLVITGTYPLNISYTFTAGQNNGKIASQTDNLSGETVTYQYDSLNRLITASSTQSWGETYGFDAFGNLLSKTRTGGAPTLSQSVNTATNQIVGQTYDANGNQLAGPLGALSYDAENRVASMASAGVQYAYDSRNKRVWRSILSGGNLAQQVYVYGVDGQKIGTYAFSVSMINKVPAMTNSTVLLAQFFGHKRVGTYDRLGSAKYNQSNNQAQSFYPYGEDRGTVEPNDALKLATYTRDAATGLDYADQRYYASNFGRFMSPDPYTASGGPADPRSWNRYDYTRGDPVNRLDPAGLSDTCPTCTFSVTTVAYASDSTGYDSDGGYAGTGAGTGGPVCSSTIAKGSSDPCTSAHFFGPQGTKLTIKKLSKSGKKYNQVETTLKDILESIDPKCLAFLQSGGNNLRNYVTDLLSSGLLAVGDFSVNSIAAITGTGGTNLQPGDAAIVVNNNGAFFNSSYTVDGIQGGTTEADVFILLHELGHALEAVGFQPDLDNTAAGNSNNQLIQNNCQTTLNIFK